MQVKECYWKRPGSVELYGRLWIPDVPMDALVVMVHGVGEHSGCYDDVAEKFTLQSFGFLAFDLRGHGRSSGIRGHASINLINKDLRLIIKDMSKKFPNIPIILFGHSMGGHVVLNYAVGKKVKVQGVISSSPWLKLVKPPIPLLVMAAKWGSRITPWLTVRTGVRGNQLSQGTAKKKSTKTDPLLHKKISIGFFSDLWKNSKMIIQNKHRLNIPLLLMHGTADTLTSHQTSKSFAQNSGEFTTFKQWEGMHHDLLNDEGSEEVFRYVVKWLSKQIVKDGTVQNSRKMYCVA